MTAKEYKEMLDAIATAGKPLLAQIERNQKDLAELRRRVAAVEAHNPPPTVTLPKVTLED